MDNMTANNQVWFTADGMILRNLPEECVEECSRPGESADEPVARWVRQLHFDPPRALAIPWLEEFGAWEREELGGWSDTRVAETVLWIACGDIREDGEWIGLSH